MNLGWTCDEKEVSMVSNVPWFWVLILAVLVLLARKCVPWIGQLPGDFTIHRGNLTIFIPLGTSMLISILLSVLAAVFVRR